jgi:hypothetical protein
MFISAIINLQLPSNIHNYDIFSIAFAYLILFIVGLIPMLLTFYVIKIRNTSLALKINKRINIENLFGNYFDEFKDNSVISQLFNTFYLIRRILFVAMIFYLSEG